MTGSEDRALEVAITEDDRAAVCALVAALPRCTYDVVDGSTVVRCSQVATLTWLGGKRLLCDDRAHWPWADGRLYDPEHAYSQQELLVVEAFPLPYAEALRVLQARMKAWSLPHPVEVPARTTVGVEPGQRYVLRLPSLPADQQPTTEHEVARVEHGVVFWTTGAQTPLVHFYPDPTGRWEPATVYPHWVRVP